MKKGDLQMAQRLPLDDQDRAALAALDDTFVVTPDGEAATATGEMEVEITRPADDGGARFRLTIKFPGGETLEVRIARAQLLDQLDIDVDES
jgi:hypothetical protein